MGEKSILTEAVEEATSKLLDLREEIKKFAPIPFGKEKLSARQARQRYEKMSPEEMQAMIGERGEEEVGRWIGDMETRRK